ncbi:efflux RND transporter permease subunit [Sansalvadorimonas verongulae]|uniref:efflux RND transporter permease subunit n=1 Tax=Sansalvadorimonas verongulae TaxID=2172824 RepID=UPI0012BB7E10|nr:efflux RND transporter permease subunit [Sansalvadorimonas verongulae]MTI13487.1 efflux RND transporter permease subunit [Sansalvadorimonas verongulae]
MILSELSIKRPVFATVISLLLITFGIIAFLGLPIRELPDVSQPSVTIVTSYGQASSEVIESKITNVLEDRLGGIRGIESVESRSRQGSSIISVTFTPDTDMEVAANDIREAMSRAAWRLPDDAESPIVWKNSGNGDAVLRLSLQSDTMSPIELTDYAKRILQDRFSLVSGVSSVDLYGTRDYVMRVELDPAAMAARGITADDIQAALRRENVELPGGKIRGSQRSIPVRVMRDYDTVDTFQQLVVRQDGQSTVYLKDVAHVRTGAQEEQSLTKADGHNVVLLSMVPISDANPFDVIANVKKEVEAVTPFLPEGTKLSVQYDASVFIQGAIDQVQSTLVMTMGLVILVLYIFLGNVRATLIPAVTVPVSLIAAFIVLYMMGYSINMLTLLALVLAIGLVVDDAIVVLENIHRHLEMGKTPLAAAWHGAREVGFAVIATTLVLVMTFVPIVFMGGTVGRLFSEYALTLAGAVVFSSLIALTLSPMLSSKLLKLNVKPSLAGRLTDAVFTKMENGYEKLVTVFVKRRWLGLVLLLASLGTTAVIYPQIPQTFTPPEDRGNLFVMVRGPEGASYDTMSKSMEEIEAKLLPRLGQNVLDSMMLQTPGWGASGDSSGMLILTLKDWNERDVDAFTLARELRTELSSIPNVQAFPVMRSSIGGRSEAPVQFVLGGGSFDQLTQWADTLKKIAEDNPGLTDVSLDFNQNQPQIEISINKERAQQLGVSASSIGSTLEIMLGGKNTTTFMERGEEYNVFLKAPDSEILSTSDLSKLYVRSHTTGELIRLDNLVSIEEVGKAAQLRHYNRNRAITLSANLVGDYSLGDALQFLDQSVMDNLPADVIVNYKGDSFSYRSNQSSIMTVFGLAMLIVFLVLAAQFESFVHPFVVMLTVPLGLAGALGGLLVTGETLNIYSQLAMIMLIGLATKNGILIVEFINQLRDRGRSFEQAIIEASRLRLRPILMTALTTVASSIPLMLSTGAGAESRIAIGIVIFFGVLISSVLTIVVVPSMYNLLARRTTSPEHIAHQLKQDLQAAI